MHQDLTRPEWPADNGAAFYRKPCDDDFEVLAAIRRDTPMQSLLLTVPESTDDAAIRNWMERREHEPGGMFRIIADIHTNKALGFAQVAQVHRRNGYGYGAIALAPDVRSRGLGQSTLRFLVKFASVELGLRKLLSEVRSDNYAAIRMNLSVGYRIRGTLEGHFMDSDHKTYDVVLFERMLPPPEAYTGGVSSALMPAHGMR